MTRLVSWAYAFVKRHRNVRDVVLVLCRVVAGSVTWLRGGLASLPATPPPKKVCETTRAWVEACRPASGQQRPTYREVHPPHVITRSRPRTVEPTPHWLFEACIHHTAPATFVAVIPNGRVWKEGAVITPDDQLLADVSKHMDGDGTDPYRHPIFGERALPPAFPVRGTVAVLAALVGRGYYHWMCDVLPRLELLRCAGWDLDRIDKFIVNDYVARFHVETLARFGISKRRVLNAIWHPHVTATTLVVPSLPGCIGNTPGWACEFLRRSFLPDGSQERVRPDGKRLYINRRHVTHRRLRNEQEIAGYLKTLGFEDLATESLSVVRQAELMSSAAVIVAPHGAGLTNLVFCRPGTVVVEMFAPTGVDMLFWALSNQVGMRYYYLIGEGERPPDFVETYALEDSMTIPVDTLAETLRRAGIG